MQPAVASPDLQNLLAIMARLRTLEIGCPWDLKQTFDTIAPYTIEEAYEVADAIARRDMAALKDELGDLLLQVVFHARMAEEESAFAFGDVVQALSGKLIRRHPHVFGAQRGLNPEDVKRLWEEIKAEERKEKSAGGGLLADVPLALPALTRAEKIQKRAANAGFDWPDMTGVLDKISEEIEELKAADTQEATEDELGDLLFSVVNYARRSNVDPELALRNATQKFERRFEGVERRVAASGKPFQKTPLDELEAYWQAEKKGG
ncbi:MAG TPA: nucleoside triphosphate pyrophosphohydrolase [Xanthobacteraceae bacterium]|nr:nucleoside triphosphate pyrophosphohydrolase [Xanthobacteraceae bacterium]